jgi:L-alanine-DL-glutamate epimerase-like enolase superfamily enzyme
VTIDPLIESVEAAAYKIPTDAPEGDGTLAWDATTMVLARVRAGDTEGIGWTYGSAAAATVIANELTPVVEGRPALDVPGTTAAMIRAVRNVTRPGVAGYAISAVDIALWDLKAKLLGLPLFRLLGAVRNGWAVEQRIPRVKIKIGESWGGGMARDLARMRQAREIVGDGVELYVDANGGYGRKQAIRVMAAAADLDIGWFEEPVSSDDLDGLREVRDAVTPDVAAGEYGWDIFYFRRMCATGAVDCLQADASRCGGITEWLRTAAVAASFGLQLSGHCAPHLHAHAAAAIPNFRHLEWFHDHVRIESTFFDGTLDPAGGVIRPASARPGLGLEFRAADAEKYRTS